MSTERKLKKAMEPQVPRKAKYLLNNYEPLKIHVPSVVGYFMPLSEFVS
jgi:hypothetical protein